MEFRFQFENHFGLDRVFVRENFYFNNIKGVHCFRNSQQEGDSNNKENAKAQVKKLYDNENKKSFFTHVISSIQHSPIPSPA